MTSKEGSTMNIAATGWYAPVLLLTPNEERDTADMANVMDHVARNAELRVGVEDVYLVTETGRIGPVNTGPEWADQARRQRQAVLILGPKPRRSDKFSYIYRYGAGSLSAIMRVVPNT
jgi:hypothetical protein